MKTTAINQCEISALISDPAHWAEQRAKLAELKQRFFGNKQPKKTAAPIEQAPDHLRARARQLAVMNMRRAKVIL